jgi:hypothetical protein
MFGCCGGKMTLEQISYLSQTIAAVAVVVSLVYLAIQVRQTERNQRAMMQQVRTDRGIALSKCFTEPQMAALLTKMLEDRELVAEEQAQLQGYVRSLTLNLLDAYALRSMGLLSDQAFERAGAGARWFLSYPHSRAVWIGMVRQQFTPPDAVIIDKMVIDGVLLAPPENLVEVAKKAREALRAG